MTSAGYMCRRPSPTASRRSTRESAGRPGRISAWTIRTTCTSPPTFFFSSRRRHTILQGDWSSDVCSSDLEGSMSMLDGKLALVTGASRGIGRAIALELKKQGAQVVGTATSEAGASGITGAGLVGKVLDVKNAEQCDALVKELGDVLILVNN